MIRSGHTTYYVDVKETRKGGKYLAITEYRIDAEDRRQRVTIRVFGHAMEEFPNAVSEAVKVAFEDEEG